MLARQFSQLRNKLAAAIRRKKLFFAISLNEEYFLLPPGRHHLLDRSRPGARRRRRPGAPRWRHCGDPAEAIPQRNRGAAAAGGHRRIPSGLPRPLVQGDRKVGRRDFFIKKVFKVVGFRCFWGIKCRDIWAELYVSLHFIFPLQSLIKFCSSKRVYFIFLVLYYPFSHPPLLSYSSLPSEDSSRSSNRASPGICATECKKRGCICFDRKHSEKENIKSPCPAGICSRTHCWRAERDCNGAGRRPKSRARDGSLISHKNKNIYTVLLLFPVLYLSTFVIRCVPAKRRRPWFSQQQGAQEPNNQ